LYLSAAVEGFVRRKKKGIARKAAKTQRQSAAAESQTVRTTISLRLCALARRKIRRGGLAKTPRRKGSAEANRHWMKKKTLFLHLKNPIPRKLPELP
jgi:hypothetical protein